MAQTKQDNPVARLYARQRNHSAAVTAAAALCSAVAAIVRYTVFLTPSQLEATGWIIMCSGVFIIAGFALALGMHQNYRAEVDKVRREVDLVVEKILDVIDLLWLILVMGWLCLPFVWFFFHEWEHRNLAMFLIVLLVIVPSMLSRHLLRRRLYDAEDAQRQADKDEERKNTRKVMARRRGPQYETRRPERPAGSGPLPTSPPDTPDSRRKP